MIVAAITTIGRAIPQRSLRGLRSLFVSVTVVALPVVMAAQATRAATPSQRMQCHRVCVQSQSMGPARPAECLRWVRICK